MLRTELEMEKLDDLALNCLYDAIDNSKVQDIESERYVFLGAFWSGLNAMEEHINYLDGFDDYKKEIRKEFGKFGPSAIRQMIDVAWWGYESGYYTNVDQVLNSNSTFFYN